MFLEQFPVSAAVLRRLVTLAPFELKPTRGISPIWTSRGIDVIEGFFIVTMIMHHITRKMDRLSWAVRAWKQEHLIRVYEKNIQVEA